MLTEYTNNLSPKKRVLIVDDHAILREGVTALINNEPDLVVCGEAASAAEALESLEEVRPDIALIDLSLGENDGIELIRAMKALRPDLPVLVLSAHDETRYAERALRAGALGYVMKSRPSESLLKAIRTVLAGMVSLSEEVQPIILGRLLRQDVGGTERPEDRLSQRELLVFEKLGSGLATQQIAKEMNLSPHTVQRYRENIKRKLGLASAAQLHHAAFDYVHKSKSE